MTLFLGKASVQLGGEGMSWPEVETAALAAERTMKIPLRVVGIEPLHDIKPPNDTALNWALRFLGWPRLGAPGELALTPGEVRSLPGSERTVIIDVAAAENASSGNGHGYFIKSPWVSTDLLLAIGSAAPPGERGLSRAGDDFIWHFPANYPEAVQRAMGSP